MKGIGFFPGCEVPGSVRYELGALAPLLEGFWAEGSWAHRNAVHFSAYRHATAWDVGMHCISGCDFDFFVFFGRNRGGGGRGAREGGSGAMRCKLDARELGGSGDQVK